MSVVDAVTTSARVRQQYEFLPYPARNADDERRRLLMTGLDDLSAINHYCFRGQRNMHAGFRVLIAGGGTGDSVVFLAHQLRNTRAEIVYVDLSQASMAIAQQRLKVRGLESRVHWIHGSLLDLPQFGLGRFDYINCSGVLHHLSEPESGLKALRQVLKDDGGMGIMVYGQYGRTGVYQMQELFRRIGDPNQDMGAQVTEARGLLSKLPPANWYQRGADLFASIKTVNESELLDLFLHTQDRAYTVPQLYEFAGSAGLNLVEWSAESRVWYQPTIAFQDERIRERVLRLPRPEQEAACELFWGTIIKHAFWLSPQPDTAASWTDEGMTPTWSRLSEVFQIRQALQKHTEAQWAINLEKAGGAKVQVRLNLDAVTRAFVNLADGFRPIDSILNELQPQFPEKSRALLNAECQETFRLLNTHDLLLLRHRTIPFFN